MQRSPHKTTQRSQVPLCSSKVVMGAPPSPMRPPFLAAADAGYLVIVPDRAGGKESVAHVFAGLAEEKPASDHNAMSADGPKQVATKVSQV